MEHTTFVGLDVHKRATSVAIAEPGRGGEVRSHPTAAQGAVDDPPDRAQRVVRRHPRPRGQSRNRTSVNFVA
jgi:transposase